MNEELEVLKIVTHRLNKAKIPYLISGSIAANYYTIPRMTRDIDVVVELKQDSVDAFIKLFEKDFYTDREMIKAEVARRGMFNLIHEKHVVKVDFIVRKETDFQDKMFLRKKEISIQNNAMQIISAEDLVLAKLLWAKDSLSEMQLKDIKNIIKTVDTLDIGYIDNWIEQLGLREIYRQVAS